MSMFIATQFTIAKSWKWNICPSTDESIKKMCYCAIKEVTLEFFVGKWTHLETVK